jgi:hypothetical protein
MWRHAPKKNTVRKKQFGKLFNIKKGIHDRILPFHKTASPFGHFFAPKKSRVGDHPQLTRDLSHFLVTTYLNMAI